MKKEKREIPKATTSTVGIKLATAVLVALVVVAVTAENQGVTARRGHHLSI